jgi:hypothetical protein
VIPQRITDGRGRCERDSGDGQGDARSASDPYRRYGHSRAGAGAHPQGTRLDVRRRRRARRVSITSRRKSDGPREFLRGYTGYVQADAANLYDRLYSDDHSEQGGAIEVGCWAHSRRRFFEAQLTDRERALIGLGFIKKLYEADRVASRAPPIRRTEERRRLAAPVLEAFKA